MSLGCKPEMESVVILTIPALPPGTHELREMVDTLEQEAECVSTLLVKLLYVRDKRVSRLTKQFGKLTTILKDYAEGNGIGLLMC